MLLLNIVETRTGQQVCDHLWLTVRKRIAALDLQQEDHVEFDARISSYRKFHRGECRDENFHYRDYKLSYPTNLVKAKASTESIG